MNKKAKNMFATPLIAYLECEIFFPVLRAQPGDYCGKEKSLEAAQCAAIDALREVYYADACKPDTQVFVTTLNSKSLQAVWRLFAEMGFASPLDGRVQCDLLKLVWGDEDTELLAA